MRYAIVDVETTGFSPENDRVVEIGCAVLEDGRITHTWNSLVNPGCAIPPYATAVHGITDADVAGAPPLASLANRIVWICGGATIVAHNARFDSSFLPMLSEQRWLCTVHLARRAFPEAPNWRLQTLRDYLGIRHDVRFSELTAHRALADALITAELLRLCLRTLS